MNKEITHKVHIFDAFVLGAICGFIVAVLLEHFFDFVV